MSISLLPLPAFQLIKLYTPSKWATTGYRDLFTELIWFLSLLLFPSILLSQGDPERKKLPVHATKWFRSVSRVKQSAPDSDCFRIATKQQEQKGGKCFYIELLFFCHHHSVKPCKSISVLFSGPPWKQQENPTGARELELGVFELPCTPLQETVGGDVACKLDGSSYSFAKLEH